MNTNNSDLDKKIINEIELYKLWRWISHKISWKDYKEQLLQNGWIIYSIEME